MPYFSICIPNFNYQRYLGLTLDSVLNQSFTDLEVLVSDNASTDGSVALVQDYQQRDARIKLRVNRCNVGFAGNLARASTMASGRFMLMLSSDDLMDDGALAAYRDLFEALGDTAERSIVHSSLTVVDSDGRPTGERRIDWKLWKGAVLNEALSARVGAPVYEIDAATVLRNSLTTMRVPFYFLSTAYSKALHDAMEGYSQGGLFNPDKRFAWALLGHAEKAYLIDKPLFRYRIHAANQTALQASSGALKHLVDEYVASFSLDTKLLDRAKLTRDQFVAAFVEHDVALRAFKLLAEGDRKQARRWLDFGRGCYPEAMAANRKILLMRLLLAAGPLGALAARLALGSATRLWQQRMTAASNGAQHA